MIYTQMIQKAIRFAIQIHELDTKKRRKGTEIPYVTHPLTVGLILGRVTKNENIIAAGVLHDTIEDCEPYGKINKAFIEKEFNADVARMVDDVTEQNKNLPWMERKMAALSHVKDMKHDSILVKSADVLHNLMDLNENIRKKPNTAFKYFNASKKDVIIRYKKLILEIRKYYPENPLINELESALITLLKLTEK